MCRRLDTIPACDRQTDGQTDGNATASTALAIRALRRAVKMCSNMVDNVLLILVRMRTWPKQQFFELLRCIIYDGSPLVALTRHFLVSRAQYT